MIAEPRFKKMLEETTIFGNLLGKMESIGALGKVLDFGCGFGELIPIIRYYYPEARLTCYDSDESKIEHIKNMISSHSSLPRNLELTSQRPRELFDSVLAFNVLHENPEDLTKEVISLVREGGYLGVLDYDMKDIPREDFFQRWHTSEEVRERRQLGDDLTYRLHTYYCLKDCSRTMRRNGIKRIYSKGNMKSLSGNLPPALIFIYLGKKLNENGNMLRTA